MENNSDIPDEVIPFLRIILYFTFHISEVNEEKKSLTRYLRHEYLNRVVGEQKEDFIRSLSWALDNPNKQYKAVLPGIKFSNEDCVKLLGIFLSHMRRM